MSCSRIRKESEKPNLNWEEALRQYQNVMASESEAVKVKATVKLANLSQCAPENILNSTIPIIAKHLGDNPITNSSQSMQGAAAYCLRRISCRGDDGTLAMAVGNSGALESLLRLLPYSNGGFRKILVKCVWSVVTFGKTSRVIIARNGGLEVIIGMLDSVIDASRRYLLEILSALALLREVRKALISLRGLPFLVEAARCGCLASRERACQAIGLLAITKRGRRMLFELGVVPVLIELFRGGDCTTKLVAGNSLGIVSAHVAYIRPVAQAGAIPLFADLLQWPNHPIGKEIAEDVFCLLAVAEENAVVISDHLVRILKEGDDEAKAAAADVLWDLSGYKYSISTAHNSGAIPVMVDLLQDRNNEVREKVSGAIAQLSYNEIDRAALADAGAIERLIELLQDELEELKDNAAEALINFSEDLFYCGRVSEAVSTPAFRNMQERMTHIRTTEQHSMRSLRQMGIDQLTRDPDL
ncbi:uncharacterized protein LOC111010437 [Momordica charantia]|uniref:Uncharacterized protein LOC111010437 n=1 Tax=Momordica charantia TaxID=3673 RepID=A0A6J1CFX3_MOMCH|nr:uncharacterized protein LOC111010437 [Momordica charantia]